MEKIKHVIGVVTYVEENTDTRRVEMVKKSLPTLRKLKNENNFIFIWDNNSCESHKNFLKENCSFVDNIFFSSKNLYDFASMHCILEIAKRKNAPYITSIEDDMEIFNETAIDACYSFLDDNVDCEHVRLAKFDYDNIQLYDKLNKLPNTDLAHAQRMFNQVTKQGLVWEELKNYNGFRFFKNNWHWSSWPSVCKTSLFEKLLPKQDFLPLMGLEKEMYHRFQDLNLKTGVLNGGCIIHNQPDFSSVYSIRMADKKQENGISTNLVSYDEIQKEINKLLLEVI